MSHDVRYGTQTHQRLNAGRVAIRRRHMKLPYNKKHYFERQSLGAVCGCMLHRLAQHQKDVEQRSKPRSSTRTKQSGWPRQEHSQHARDT